eukprot:TRINITY_DN65723_c2_g1_i1.p1 TRINITY_DN65723_c2_g1~~TRINITY_DN65723_c2_g1_i1.p1  ORF type:complete len:289 (+),score=20.36 TRINITY_DN65723_c2_g1_i1:94-960(+)
MPVPPVNDVACNGDRFVGCGVQGCNCRTYVIGLHRHCPTSSAVTCGRPGCGHTWHSHLTANGGDTPTPVPNPYPAVNGLFAFYLIPCAQGICHRAAPAAAAAGTAGVHDIANGNNGPPLRDVNQCQGQHLSCGIKGASEDGDDPLWDDSTHTNNLARLRDMMEPVKELKPVNRALQFYESYYISDTYVLVQVVIQACLMYKFAVCGRKEDDDEEETDLERKMVNQHGEAVLTCAQDVLTEASAQEELEEDIKVLKWLMQHFQAAQTVPGMQMLQAISANTIRALSVCR